MGWFACRRVEKKTKINDKYYFAEEIENKSEYKLKFVVKVGSAWKALDSTTLEIEAGQKGGYVV